MAETEPEWLPEFPTDDAMLDRIEHALGGAYRVEDDGAHVLVGADYTLTQLLDFMAGVDDSLLIPLNPDGANDWFEYPFPVYSEHDLLRALIAEIRRLRPTADQDPKGGASL